YRINFFGDEIEEIVTIDPVSGRTIEKNTEVTIYPATIFVTSPDRQLEAIWNIQEDMVKQTEYMKSLGQNLEAKRLEDRVTYDLEMIRELGYCSGIENYSRYFDGREPGTRPFCLIDYFPENWLMVVDESHVTIPQIRAMYGGDRSRKQNLVEYGFRLPSALDNRPLKFEEWESMVKQIIYVSATPADYELQKSEGVLVEQVIRPTGLLDPVIEVRPSINQVDDLLEEIDKTVKAGQRVLVTTLTKRMAEELTKYMTKLNINCRYIHSEVVTLDRVELLRDLRLGNFDVLVGINLLREGLDLPEVSLVAILDADKEGFLRSNRSLTQTAGRAARNINGRVIFYADKMTDSMQKTIDETHRRREKQIKYNEEHGLSPQQIVKSIESIMGQTKVADSKHIEANAYVEGGHLSIAADPVVKYMKSEDLKKLIAQTRKSMEKAARDLDFIEAARLRDEMYELEKLAGS
ncbi:MAG: UvrB/UvrC motif-containing protein, partial [Bacteroidia bacterium]|nr:UvrB/UvrC motif-containing protein [Bacteroidia bacterium]